MRTVEEDNVKERIENLIKKVNVAGGVVSVSSWEQGFLESVHRQLQSGRRALSGKQLDIVHRVEAKIEKALKGDPEWEAQWDEDKAWAWKTACNYYNAGTPRYYSNILDWAAANPDKTPSHAWYQKVVENKYAQKIINALRAEPKYNAGMTVTMRANGRAGLSYYDWNAMKGIPLFVIEATDRAVTAAVGCRIYKVLSSVAMTTYEVEERFIKKWKEPKTPKTPKKSNTSMWDDIAY